MPPVMAIPRPSVNLHPIAGISTLNDWLGGSVIIAIGVSVPGTGVDTLLYSFKNLLVAAQLKPCIEASMAEEPFIVRAFVEANDLSLPAVEKPPPAVCGFNVIIWFDAIDIALRT